MKEIQLDFMGEKCPAPVVKTLKTLDALDGPAVLKVLVDNEIAASNLSKLCKSRKLEFGCLKITEDKYAITIQAEAGGLAKVPEDCSLAEPEASSLKAMELCDCAKKETVVAISGKAMGGGDEKLGEILMKGFIYALSEMDELPSAVICYNGGAYYSCVGSPALEDLKRMEEAGTEILTCGTCLDYYSLKDKLAVGKVTNMYDIAGRLMAADKVIRP